MRKGFFTENYLNQLKAMFSEVKSRKGIINSAYACYAYRTAGKELGIDNELVAAGKYTLPWSILTELGRFEDKKKIKYYARQLLEVDWQSWNVKALISMIRSDRTGKEQVLRCTCARCPVHSEDASE
jgi:hypothetical protein